MKVNVKEIHRRVDEELKRMGITSREVRNHVRKSTVECEQWCADFDEKYNKEATKTFKETKKTTGVCLIEWGKHYIEV